MVPIIAALMVSRMVHFDRFLLRFNTHRSSIKPSNDNKKKKKFIKNSPSKQNVDGIAQQKLESDGASTGME